MAFVKVQLLVKLRNGIRNRTLRSISNLYGQKVKFALFPLSDTILDDFVDMGGGFDFYNFP
jgi:hypothetical protein